jgi:hypothetical protein
LAVAVPWACLARIRALDTSACGAESWVKQKRPRVERSEHSRAWIPKGCDVAGSLGGRALTGPGGITRSDAPLTEQRRQLRQDLGQVGEGAHDRRPGERAREVAVLAMRRTARGEVAPSIDAGRNGLRPASQGHGDDQRQGQVGLGIALRQPGQPVARQPHHLGAKRRRTRGHGLAIGPGLRRDGRQHALRHRETGGTGLAVSKGIAHPAVGHMLGEQVEQALQPAPFPARAIAQIQGAGLAPLCLLNVRAP